MPVIKESNVVFEHLYGYAPKDRPSQVTFYEDGRLNRNVELNTLGAYGWELVSVILGLSETGEPRYEYWLKRNKTLRLQSERDISEP